MDKKRYLYIEAQQLKSLSCPKKQTGRRTGEHTETALFEMENMKNLQKEKSMPGRNLYDWKETGRCGKSPQEDETQMERLPSFIWWKKKRVLFRRNMKIERTEILSRKNIRDIRKRKKDSAFGQIKEKFKEKWIWKEPQKAWLKRRSR